MPTHRPPPAASPTALVVAEDPADRGRAAGLLAAGGWVVSAAADVREAVRAARRTGPDLVVSALAQPRESAALLRRLRLAGCRAHLVVVARGARAGDRAELLAAGAVACLPELPEPGLVARLLLTRLPPVAAPAPGPALPDDREVGRLEAGLREDHARALPGRVRAVADAAHGGDPVALAAAAGALAGVSGQLGDAEVAGLSSAIARAARRGEVADDLVGVLVTVAGQPTSR
ncbi:hypothetical protein [Geodermatophilus marinus]|uniref:hypothetical protein n=1 Tax=Geodermatophilus sp. LHW52908 TaxID=2303986 RepID=UPI0013144772|nr:hypothetical protein [Geodermatophilus sp. LHW52908]